jgi:hypothetical protein
MKTSAPTQKTIPTRTASKKMNTHWPVSATLLTLLVHVITTNGATAEPGVGNEHLQVSARLGTPPITQTHISTLTVLKADLVDQNIRQLTVGRECQDVEVSKAGRRSTHEWVLTRKAANQLRRSVVLKGKDPAAYATATVGVDWPGTYELRITCNATSIKAEGKLSLVDVP